MYLAQRADTIEGDFCQLVDTDMDLIDLQLTDNQICSLTSFDFKKLVKLKAKQAAFKYLIEVKETKSKMSNITYMSSFLAQPYMLNMTREQASLMMALRTRTLRGIRTDFGDMFLNKQCPLAGCQQLDSISHLLTCSVLKAAVPAEDTPIQYGDVFSDSQETQKSAIVRFSQLVEARTGLLEQKL